MTRLKQISIEGFRSIKSATIEFQDMNVLIGANGSGKSNLIAVFKLLNEMMGGRLQNFVAATGRASANLHFGPKRTPQMQIRLTFEVENGQDFYSARLFHAAGDSLVFAEEMVSFLQTGFKWPKEVLLGAGHAESKIDDQASLGEPTSKTLRFLLNRCRVFHFHDTSPTARVRQYCYVGDNRWLKPDAANLAAVLLRLSQENESVYRRIVATIRQVAPFFDDFVLDVQDNRDIILNWRHHRSDLVFGPHQLSDGTLRAICLIGLLLQPEQELPALIVVDEPELGLHPFALGTIAALFQAASRRTQVLVSTQSSTFLDHFDPDHVIVVERHEEASSFVRQTPEKLDAWLEEYSLGEVWEKNVIGGGPH